MIIRQSAIARTKKFEGSCDYFYLDTKKKVTVGCGRMLPTASDAAALNMIDTSAGQDATAQAKRDAWSLISGKPAGKPAAYYEPFTTVRLKPGGADALLKENLSGFATELLTAFPKLDDYPEAAQDALLDMIFNLGRTNFPKNWPNLAAAVKAKKWVEAGAESHRPDVQPARNDEIKALFESAAEPGSMVAEGWFGRAGGPQEGKAAGIHRVVEALSRPGLFRGGLTHVRLSIKTGDMEFQLDMSGHGSAEDQALRPEFITPPPMAAPGPNDPRPASEADRAKLVANLPASKSIAGAAALFEKSCAGGDDSYYENNCAHFLSNAFILAGYSELAPPCTCISNGGRCLTKSKRPIRARDMWCWFKEMATSSQVGLPTKDGLWAVFQLDTGPDPYWGGHVVIIDTDTNTYHGTANYPGWEQYCYRW